MFASFNGHYEETHKMYVRNGVQRHYKHGMFMVNKIIVTDFPPSIACP
jgi:hypothetical protein